jgi:hypothetical protein
LVIKKIGNCKNNADSPSQFFVTVGADAGQIYEREGRPISLPERPPSLSLWPTTNTATHFLAPRRRARREKLLFASPLRLCETGSIKEAEFVAQHLALANPAFPFHPKIL